MATSTVTIDKAYFETLLRRYAAPALVLAPDQQLTFDPQIELNLYVTKPELRANEI
jgi:hypothetical protein